MTVNELLVLVRQRLGDMQKLSFSDAELLICLNNAMDELCIDMANRFDPEILRTLTLTESGVELPENFIAWQGQYALDYSNSTDTQTIIKPMDPNWDGTNPTLKYFAYKPHFTSLNDKIPFRTGVHEKALMVKCIYQVKPQPEGGAKDDSKGTSGKDSGSGASQ